MDAFQILESDKVGLDADEGYVVVRDGLAFMRILGAEPNWSLMTATASEDRGHIRVCPEQRRLLESALRLCAERGVDPEVRKDWRGREYVHMGTITAEPDESEEDFQKWTDELLGRFFEIFDGYRNPGSRSGSEMRELYEALAIDDEGSEVYLSDGVWLSSDGSLHDRGR